MASSSLRRANWLDGAITAACVSAIDGVLAWRAPEGGRSDIFFRLILGPFEGWAGATRQGLLPSALPLLLLTTTVTVVPIAIYALSARRVGLAVGAFSWVFACLMFVYGVAA